MSFWWRVKRDSGQSTDTGRAQKAKRKIKHSPPVAMEVKVLAIEALGADTTAPRAEILRRVRIER